MLKPALLSDIINFMNNNQHIFSLLMVDDEPSVLSLLKKIFIEDDYQIHTAQNAQDALLLIRTVRVDAALIDMKMPGMDGFSLLKELRNDFPQIMSIILTGYGGTKEAVEAIKLGAVDFLEKPFSPEGLRARVAQLYRIWELSVENRKLKDAVEFQFGFERLIGNSTDILRLKQMIVQAGPSDASILIQGETGTGKELVARAIHHHSKRSEFNFVPVDCAAISETVIESELFGHVKGAFTGAHISTLGLIRSGNEGTLFLDEVGELSPAIQAKFLRTIQENEVRPVGSSKSYKVDVRIVAATNSDLAAEVAEGNFREDLFYRLNVITIHVPPLRDRKDDISLLARFFVKRFSSEFSPVREISKQALICLENYNWPGNIRELENVIRRGMVLGKSEFFLPEDLPPEIYSPPVRTSESNTIAADDSLAAYEKVAIQNALRKSGNSRRKAAKILEIGEATLYRKISKYGMKT